MSVSAQPQVPVLPVVDTKALVFPFEADCYLHEWRMPDRDVTSFSGISATFGMFS